MIDIKKLCNATWRGGNTHGFGKTGNGCNGCVEGFYEKINYLNIQTFILDLITVADFYGRISIILEKYAIELSVSKLYATKIE